MRHTVRRLDRRAIVGFGDCLIRREILGFELRLEGGHRLLVILRILGAKQTGAPLRGRQIERLRRLPNRVGWPRHRRAATT
jgi:hypothetical protein